MVGLGFKKAILLEFKWDSFTYYLLVCVNLFVQCFLFTSIFSCISTSAILGIFWFINHVVIFHRWSQSVGRDEHIQRPGVVVQGLTLTHLALALLLCELYSAENHAVLCSDWRLLVIYVFCLWRYVCNARFRILLCNIHSVQKDDSDLRRLL